MRRELVRLSKFMSLVLRHRPEEIGLRLDAQGWVELDALVERARAGGVDLDRETVREIVETNDKRRFALSADGLRIRASQGHSVEVDLALEPVEPPARLYHGTTGAALESILAEGLLPRGRHHVHLSPDRETARRIGARRGKPVVLEIDAAGMHAAGTRFYRSANGVWLTAAVPAAYIRGPDPGLAVPRPEQP